MSDPVVKLVLVKLALSIILALVAWSAHRIFNRAHLTHLLWLLVLLTMLTPALVPLRVIDPPPVQDLPASTIDEAIVQTLLPQPATSHFAQADFLSSLTANLSLIWLAGSLLVCAFTLFRIFRFHKLLVAAAQPGSPALQQLAQRVARRFALTRVPLIVVADARISPLLWWLGNPVRIVIPTALTETLNEEQLYLIVAHEMAHIKRRDHIVRWFEWLACVVFWWNPITWWARRSLRHAEEICCDSLVLEKADANPRGYASSLIAVVDFLAMHAAPTASPAPVTAIQAVTTGRTYNLERRLRMIVSKDQRFGFSRRGRAGLLTLAAIVLPLGLINITSRTATTARADDSTTSQQSCEAMATRLRTSPPGDAAAADRLRQQVAECESKARTEELASRIRLAVQQGIITENQAREILGGGSATLVPDISGDGERINPEMRRLMDAERMRSSDPAVNKANDELRRLLVPDQMSRENARLVEDRVRADEELRRALDSRLVPDQQLRALGMLNDELHALRMRDEAMRAQGLAVDEQQRARLRDEEQRAQLLHQQERALSMLDQQQRVLADQRDRLSQLQSGLERRSRLDVNTPGLRTLCDQIALVIERAVQDGTVTAEQGRERLAAICR